jgi:hypothetical protein
VIGNASALFNHLRIRLIWTLRDPAGLSLILLLSLGALFYWPGPDPLSIESEPVAYSATLWVLWLWLWPAIPAIYAAGRASGGRGASTRVRAIPTLPVGGRSRVLAEALVVLAVVAVVRTASSFALANLDSESFAVDTAIGSLLMLPLLIAWAAPSQSLELHMLRPLVVALVLLGTALLGLTATPAGVLMVSLGVSALVLATIHTTLPMPDLRGGVPPRTDRYRTGIDPARRLARDAWQLVFDRWGIPLALLAAVVAVVLALDVRQLAPPYSLLQSAAVFLVVMVTASLQPFASKLIALGLTGRSGVRSGDFVRAWPVLPVRPEAVLRRVYAHGLVFGGLAWSGAVAIILIRTWMRYGVFGLRAADGGKLGELVIPFAAAAPCLAGVLTAAAVGDRLRTAISGVALIMVFHGHPMILIALSTTLGNDSTLAHGLHLAVMVVVALVGGLPPLVHTRRAD